MSKYRITMENIPGMGGTLESAPLTIECDGLYVIGVTRHADGECVARTAIHALSSEDIANVIAKNPPLRLAVMAYARLKFREQIEGGE